MAVRYPLSDYNILIQLFATLDLLTVTTKCVSTRAWASTLAYRSERLSVDNDFNLPPVLK